MKKKRLVSGKAEIAQDKSIYPRASGAKGPGLYCMFSMLEGSVLPDKLGVGEIDLYLGIYCTLFLTISFYRR